MAHDGVELMAAIVSNASTSGYMAALAAVPSDEAANVLAFETHVKTQWVWRVKDKLGVWKRLPLKILGLVAMYMGYTHGGLPAVGATCSGPVPLSYQQATTAPGDLTFVSNSRLARPAVGLHRRPPLPTLLS